MSGIESKVRRRYRRVRKWTAKHWGTIENVGKFVTVVASISALVISTLAFFHTNETDSDQAMASRHQELVTLIQSLGHIYSQEHAIQVQHPRDARTLLGEVSDTQQADAEEGRRLITEIGATAVSPAESLLVGEAFGAKGEQKLAIALYTDAIEAGQHLSNLGTPSASLADAYRQRALAEYALGDTTTAHADMTLADQSKTTRLGYGLTAVIGNRLFTASLDVPEEMAFKNDVCAEKEINDADQEAKRDTQPNASFTGTLKILAKDAAKLPNVAPATLATSGSSCPVLPPS
jgi:hypothetical protein